MKDYLEELVELVWREEDGLSDNLIENYSVWNGTVGAGWKQSSAEALSALEQNAEAEHGDSVMEKSMSVPDWQILQGRQKNDAAQWKQGDEPMLRRTAGEVVGRDLDRIALGQNAEQMSQVLRSRLAQAEQASRYRMVSRQEERTPSFQPVALQKDGVSGAAGIEARQVDRVFERDARRYDNRYTLF